MRQKFRKTKGDIVYDAVVYTTIAIITVVMVYPFLYALSTSVSSRYALTANQVRLLPIDPHLGFYRLFYDRSVLNIFLAYKNSLVYAIATSACSIFMNALFAYPMMKKDLVFRKGIMIFILIPMFVGGTFVQFYIMMTALKIIDTMWALVLPAAMSTYNMVIVRTYFQSLPGELIDSAQIDGAGHMRILMTIVLPLSKPVLAIIGMWAFVGQWNSYFGPLLYLNDLMKYPLTLVLQRAMDFSENIYGSSVMDFNVYADLQGMKAAGLVISFLPMLVLYPFVQKYFVRGVMIGSLKG